MYYTARGGVEKGKDNKSIVLIINHAILFKTLSTSSMYTCYNITPYAAAATFLVAQFFLLCMHSTHLYFYQPSQPSLLSQWNIY